MSKCLEMSKKKGTLKTFQSTGVYESVDCSQPIQRLTNVPLALDHVARDSLCTSKCLFTYALLIALSCAVEVVDGC